MRSPWADQGLARVVIPKDVVLFISLSLGVDCTPLTGPGWTGLLPAGV